MKLASIHQSPEQQSQELLRGIYEAVGRNPLEGVQTITTKGDKGDKGESPTEEQLLELIQGLIPPPVKGDTGDTPNIDQVANMVHSRINLKKIAQMVMDMVTLPKDGSDGLNGSPDEPDDIVAKLNQSKIPIQPHRIAGLRDALYTMDQIGKHPVGQNVGGNNALIIQDSTGARLSDYVTVLKLSTGITPVYSGNGVVTLTAAGGSSGFQAPLSGALTGTNTWTTAPNVLVIDGVPRQKVQTDGTINWTGSTTTVLTNAPVPTFDIYAAS